MPENLAERLAAGKVTSRELVVASANASGGSGTALVAVNDYTLAAGVEA